MAAPKGNQYAKGHGKGRPKEYRKSFIDDVYKYVDDCVKRSIEHENHQIPTIEGVAEMLGFSRETVREWTKEDNDFSRAIEYCKAQQCKQLINNGLLNRYNPTITKLMLSSNHGYKERTESKQEIEVKVNKTFYGDRADNDKKTEKDI